MHYSPNSAALFREIGPKFAADLSVLDPVITGARPTRNYAYLVLDKLYGIASVKSFR